MSGVGCQTAVITRHLSPNTFQLCIVQKKSSITFGSFRTRLLLKPTCCC
nr:MAG TPA: hypothetical protein [Caudoviricetes sp.]